MKYEKSPCFTNLPIFSSVLPFAWRVSGKRTLLLLYLIQYHEHGREKLSLEMILMIHCVPEVKIILKEFPPTLGNRHWACFPFLCPDSAEQEMAEIQLNLQWNFPPLLLFLKIIFKFHFPTVLGMGPRLFAWEASILSLSSTHPGNP